MSTASSATYLDLGIDGLSLSCAAGAPVGYAGPGVPRLEEVGKRPLKGRPFDVHPCELIADREVHVGPALRLDQLRVGGVDALIESLGREHRVRGAQFPVDEIG